MDIRRIVLYSAFALVAYTLWNQWHVDYPPAALNSTNQSFSKTEETSGAENRMLPEMRAAETEMVRSVESEEPTKDNHKTITVKTDVYNLTIDLSHGDIIKAQLSEYPVSIEQKDTPITLLQDKPSERYVANSSLFVVKGQKIQSIEPNYTASQKHYELSSDQKMLVVTLKGKTPAGLNIQKEFTFRPGDYLIEMNYQLSNKSSQPWKGYMNTQLLRSSPKEDQSSMFHIGSFTGGSYSNPGHHRYQKVPFKAMSKSSLDVEVQGGWIAMQQHYFLSAWVPDTNSENRFYTRAMEKDYTIGAVSKPIVVSPNQTQKVGARLYIGPEITSVLKGIAPGLDMTVDYGFLWFLSALLFSFMKFIYSFVGNWGWSIVLVTLFIKLAFYRLSATSYKSMANMRKLQPKLQALRERYGDDKAKISQATMELYRQEKVNPLGGCLPIIIQIPVFIALYWVLLESVELRQAPFILWIKDLASADPYHVLPVIMGATMLIQQKLNPTPPDPMQAKVMMFLPVLFTALFWNFPAGLVLYWIVNNTLSILQQWYITQKYSDNKSSNNKLVTAK